MREDLDYFRFFNTLKRRTFIAGAVSLLAAPAISNIHNRPWIVTGMTDFPPYNYFNGEKYIGTDIDILTIAARRLGVSMDFVALPWPRVLLALERYEADAAFQLAPVRKRFHEWHMVGPMRTTRLVFVVRNDFAINDIAGLDDLAGLSVGVVNGFHYTVDFNKSRSFVHEGSVDDQTSLRKLLLGRSDLIVGGEANLRFAINRLGVADRVRMLPTPLVEQNRYVGFRRDADGTDKAASMQQVLTEMMVDGTIPTLVQQIARG